MKRTLWECIRDLLVLVDNKPLTSSIIVRVLQLLEPTRKASGIQAEISSRVSLRFLVSNPCVDGGRYPGYSLAPRCGCGDERHVQTKDGNALLLCDDCVSSDKPRTSARTSGPQTSGVILYFLRPEHDVDEDEEIDGEDINGGPLIGNENNHGALYADEANQ